APTITPISARCCARCVGRAVTCPPSSPCPRSSRTPTSTSSPDRTAASSARPVRHCSSRPTCNGPPSCCPTCSSPPTSAPPASPRPAATAAARLAHRQALRDRFERRLLRAEPAVKDMDVWYHKAFDVLRSPELRRALDLGGEPAAIRERYGQHLFGQGCLL